VQKSRMSEMTTATGSPLELERPADASQASKLLDFRLNPPEVEEILLKRMPKPTKEGASILIVQFAQDSRLKNHLTIFPEGKPLVLHDDGLLGDEKANDRVFSAIVPLDFDQVDAQQKRRLAVLSKTDGLLRTPKFVGRVRVGDERIDPRDIERLRAKDITKLVPFGGGGSAVDSTKSLAVTAVNVVEDPSRTFNPCSNIGAPLGKWTFGYLMTQMANEPLTGINPSDFTLLWLRHWLTAQTVNGFTAPARNAMSGIISRWPKLPDGRLDLAKAPVKLLAIMNRIDLASNPIYGKGSGGEGRFVFGVLDTSAGGCNPVSFTIILEYGIPRHTCMEIKDWAQKWEALGSLALGSTAYNSALELITEEFVRANADPSKPNRSAINQIRTDEIAIGAPWELREFRIFDSDSDAGQLRQVTVKQTPDLATFNSTGPQAGPLRDWINNNAAAIVLDHHTVPALLPFPALIPLLGASSPNNQEFWQVAGITDPEARFHFSLNTCNACHGAETATGFLHVAPAAFGTPAALSRFLTGDSTTASGDLEVSDPSGMTTPAKVHAFNDLKRRAQILDELANDDCAFFVKFRPLLMPH
jgi:hypothetical protein